MHPFINGSDDAPLDAGANWARIRAELAVLDVFLEHAVLRKAADPRKQSLNPFQGVILESADILSRFYENKHPIGMDTAAYNQIREHDEEIEAEPVGSSRLGYLAATLRLQRFEERCLILALAPELDSKYSETYAYLQNNISCMPRSQGWPLPGPAGGGRDGNHERTGSDGGVRVYNGWRQEAKRKCWNYL